MTDTAPDDRLLELEIEKHRLECEKLRAEIAEVRQPLWKRSGYIASLSPMVIALVAFFSAWVTGYFDTQKKVLQNELDTLTAQVETFKADVADLDDRRVELSAQNADLQKRVASLSALRDELSGLNRELQDRIDKSYLALKAVAGEARYALGHYGAFAVSFDIARKYASPPGRDRVPDDLARFLDEVLERESMMTEIVAITERELEKLAANLDVLPASAWTKPLRYEPTPEGTLLFAPDGRVFDMTGGLFYDDIEALRAGRPSGRQKE